MVTMTVSCAHHCPCYYEGEVCCNCQQVNKKPGTQKYKIDFSGRSGEDVDDDDSKT